MKPVNVAIRSVLNEYEALADLSVLMVRNPRVGIPMNENNITFTLVAIRKTVVSNISGQRLNAAVLSLLLENTNREG